MPKMDIKKTLKGMMGKKDKDNEQGEKKVLAENARYRDQLLSCMKQVVFRCPKGNITEEQMMMHKLNFNRLMVRLDNSKTACLHDTRKIDQRLIALCDDLQEALKNGDEITIKYVMMTFEYGIGVGHKALLKSEEEKMEYILEDREDTMEDYSKICECAIDMYKESQSVKELTQKMKELGDKYSVEMKETNKYIDTHEALYQQVLELGGNLKKMTPDQYKMAVMMQSVLRLDYDINQVILKEAIHDAKMKSLESLLNTLSIQLNEHNSLLQEELADYINNLTEKETIRITQGILQVENVSNALKGLHNAMMASFQTAGVQQSIVNTVGEFDDLRIRYETERDAYGRMMMHEHAQEIELEDDEEHTLYR